MSAVCEPGNCRSACCAPVTLPWTKSQFEQLNFADKRTREWVRDDLTRIPSSLGFKLHPHMRGRDLVDQDGNPTSPVFYTCRHYSEEENWCMSYETRPDVCRGFPFYDGDVSTLEGSTLPPSCSFNADLGREVEVRITL